ncbi:MAG: trypsin-like peptidase domain-containing protein [Candidatus Aminicenantes bacterium]|nr:trypsin-like peptidase domain-containing protein [Candidatus Aminicenantes bacterium]
MTTIELIALVRSGVAEIALERNREVLGNGSAFLVDRGLVTNSHVIRPPGQIDAFRIRFEDSDQPIRLLPEDFYNATSAESTESELDYAFVELEEEEFEGRYRFCLGDNEETRVGQNILFLGYPFGMPQLTAHMGYVSSIHEKNGKEIIQIDGSVNGGNSGGPLLSIDTGNVVGIITRAITGIIEEEFNNLIIALQNNQKILSQTKTVMQIGGFDPIQGIKVSQAAMEQIARNLKRSANVGIGYAFSINPIRSHLENLA